MNTNKLLVYPFSAAPGAFVVGICLVRTIKHFDTGNLILIVLFAACLFADLFWARREVRRLAASEVCKEERIYVPLVVHFLQHDFLEFGYTGCGLPLVWPRLLAEICFGLLECDYGYWDLPCLPRCETPGPCSRAKPDPVSVGDHGNK
jgi:hypothetical protein